MSDKLEVFISYARKDAAEFVAELATGLEVAHVVPLVDLQSISAAEKWEPRLSSLIQQADTVIFVITPQAVKSPVFNWEIGEATSRSKRLIPVMWLETPLADIPAQLSDLQIISFAGRNSFAKSLKKLVEALEIDLQWVREHTRLAERAVEWDGKYARDDNALLVGKQLVEAEAWMAGRPANAPLPTAIQLEFIAASRRLATERDSAERKRLAEIEASQAERAQMLARQARRTRQGLIALGALALVIVAIASFAFKQKQAIDEASLRLKGMVLKIADTDHPVRASEKWYGIATDYKLSIAILSRDLGDGRSEQTGSGFLMRGRTLNPAWGDELVLLTAAHVPTNDLASDLSNAEVAKLSAVFPALDVQQTVKFSEVAFHSKELDVVVLRLSGPPPKGAFPISQIGSPPDILGGIAVLHWTGTDGFAIGFGHGLAPPDSAQLTGEQGPGRLLYTHMTGPGASGAPVFDADTAELVCLHMGGIPMPTRLWAFCRSIKTIVEATSRAP